MHALFLSLGVVTVVLVWGFFCFVFVFHIEFLSIIARGCPETHRETATAPTHPHP